MPLAAHGVQNKKMDSSPKPSSQALLPKGEGRNKFGLFMIRTTTRSFFIRFPLPAPCLVVRVVDIRPRKHHAILSQRFAPLARKVKCLSRPEVGPCNRAGVSSLHDRCRQKLSSGVLWPAHQEKGFTITKVY